MGFIDDLLFPGSNKKRVTEKEFKQVRSALAGKGFSRINRDRAEAIFKPDMYEKPTSSHKKGLEENEIEARLKWLRENKSKHNFSDQQINTLEETLKKKL